MILSNGRVLASAALDSLADTTPILLDQTYYPSGSHLELSGVWASYAELYRRQVWVSTVIRKLAFAHARLPFLVTTQTETGRVAVAPDDPFADLMATPNPRTTWFSLILWTSSTWDVYGEAYWLKVRDPSKRVRELHPLHPTNLSVQRNGDTGELEYVYRAGGGGRSEVPPIPESDVVPFVNYNPSNLVRGLSNLEPLRQTLLNEDAARRATAAWWSRGARPSVLLHHPKRLSDQAQDRLRKQVEDTHGGVENTGSAMVLEEGMTATVVQLSAEQMQYIESRKLNREEVCAAYDVPPPVVHILDKATFSNITEQMRSMYRDTMAPRLGLFESIIDHHVRREFSASGELGGAFDLDGVLRGDFEARAAAVAPLVQAGVFKPSEARPLFGLPDAGPVADRLYANAAIVPLGEGGQQAPAAPESTPTDLTALGARRQLRALTGKVARKGPSEARRELVAAHGVALRALFTRQHGSAANTGSFTAEDWDPELIDLLTPLTELTARTAGSRVARLRNGSFDYERASHYLTRNVEIAANVINAASGVALVAALADPDRVAALSSLLDQWTGGRADQLAEERVSTVGNFSETEAVKQTGGGTKTWRVNSANPRQSHAAMDGETVGVDDDFSNGLHFPGDPLGDAEELANCTCSLDFGD